MQEFGWDPAASKLSDEQLWALLTNGVYFKAVAPRLDALGGGLKNADWQTGLSDWWGVQTRRQFNELVDWMRKEGHRYDWAKHGDDKGDEKIAWDYCRLITVAGGAAIAGMIEDDQAWSIVIDAGDKLGDTFSSWSAIADNYLSGRQLWLTDLGKWGPTPDLQDPTQATFMAARDLLVDDVESPWNRVNFDRANGIIIEPLAN